MRIERVTLFQVRMPLLAPFETSFGLERDHECIVVRLDGEGTMGWSECVAGFGPWYTYETITTAWHVLADFLIPAVLGVELSGPEQVAARFGHVRGHPMAKAGLEMAAWELAARQAGVSLARLLGGTRDRVAVGVSLGVQPSVAALLARVGAYVAQGYARVKIKIKPGWDVAVTRAVRAEFPDLRLQVDANSAYDLEDLAIFRRLDELDLLLIEQPLDQDDLYDHARLQAALRTPICLDESIGSADQARLALELGSCRTINIKPGRVGGHGPARRIHDLCRERGIPVWHGGMLETGIGRAHNVALASLPGFTLPGDISASSRYYATEIVDPPFTLNPDSTIDVPGGPGIGVQVDETALRRFTLREQSWIR